MENEEKSMNPTNDVKLEDVMEKLEHIVNRMESEKLSLEESYAVFSEGIELVMQGNRSIDKIEKKMKILGESVDE